jgi:transposase InsO family protein
MATVRVDVPEGTDTHYEYQRRLTRDKHAAVEAQIAEWLIEGVIERCPQSSAWNMNLVVVKKPSEAGSPPKFRVCIDPRPINRVTPNDPHPLPHILDYLDDACGASVFSSLDLRGSFHQFEVLPAHRDFLAFTWASVQYRFRRGPFGLKALAGQFQRVMSDILGDLPCVRVYIDDIIVFSNSLAEHTVHLTEVLQRLNRFLLRVQPLKCRLFRPAVPYLGHVVSGAGIRIAASRVAEIGDVDRPTSGKQLQAFLGMVNFVRSFIPCLATLAAPLDALRLSKTIDLGDRSVWTESCEEAFVAIKDAIAAAPVLAKPDWAAPFFVASDASAVGLGAVLFQGSRDDPRYIVCVSRALSSSERSYSATKRELLGLVFALRKLRFYLAGRKFHMFTDHKALTYMFEQKKLGDMLERWLDELLEFDFTVSHIPGILNVLPDCLSRLYGAGSAPRVAAVRISHVPDHIHGLPVFRQCGSFGEETEISWQDDWLPAPPLSLGGGGVMADHDSLMESAGRLNAFPVIRSVAKATASSSRTPSQAGPILDPMDADLHLPFALTKLGESVPVTPETERAQALKWAHAQGHKGSRGTFHRLLSEGFKWPGMEKDCLRAAKECVDCQRFTTQKYGFHPLRLIAADLPMDHLAIDLAQMKTSVCGHNYILVVIDICTRFVWLFALVDKSGGSVAAALKALFAQCGKPLIIQSDNGSEFRNLNFETVMKHAGIEHRCVTPYYPQANGAAERVIRTTKEHLNAICKGDTASWPHHLAEVQYGYNTTVHRRHGSTPFSLFFARSHNPWRGEAPNEPSTPITSAQLLARANVMSEVVFPAVAGRTRLYAEGVFDDFAKRHKIIKEDYPSGALVMRQIKPRSSKLLPAWEGPYVVIQRSRGGAYLLRDSTNDLLVQKVPASQLRLISYEGALSPDSFEVDHVVSHQGPPEDRSYLIRWKGFAPEFDSWVKQGDIQTLGCIADYWEKVTKSSPVQSPPNAALSHGAVKRRRPPTTHRRNTRRRQG